MKILASLLLLSFVLYTSAELFELEPRAVPQKCEDVLAQDLCDKLKEIAAALKLQASKVDDAIKYAIVKGITSAPAIYRAARDFLKNEVLNKTCEDFLAPRICVKLRKICQALKIRAEKVEEAIREVIGDGITKGTEIYVKVVDFLKKEVLSKTCEDYLAPRVCTKLRDIAKTLKIQVALVNDFVKDALIQGYEDKEEIYQAVVDFIRKEVLSKTCEDILAGPVCSQLRSIATNLKVKASEVDKFVREAVLKGYTQARDIIEAVRDWIKNEVLAKTCEDFLPDKTCSTVRNVAKRFGVKVQEVEKFLRDTIASGITKASELYSKILQFIRAKRFG